MARERVLAAVALMSSGLSAALEAIYSNLQVPPQLKRFKKTTTSHLIDLGA